MLQVNFGKFSDRNDFRIRGVIYLADSLSMEDAFKRPFTDKTIMEIVSFCHKRVSSPIEMREFLNKPNFLHALPLLEQTLPVEYELYIAYKIEEGRGGIEVTLVHNQRIFKGFDNCPFNAFRKALVCAERS